MRLNVAIPETHVKAPVLNSALEAVTRLDEALLKGGEVPTFDEGLAKGVRWKPEPPGAEHFDHATTVMRRRWGDCDDLAPWHAASLRVTGEDRDAVAEVYKSGPKRWHAIVRRGDGSIDDPSKRAGMGAPQTTLGGALPLMYTAPSAVVGGVYRVRPAIAMRPIPGGIQARADLPWFSREMQSDPLTPTDYAMVSLQGGKTPESALVGAIEGACKLGMAAGFAHPDHLDRLAAIAEALEGMPLKEISELYGDSHAEAAEQVIGSLWGGLKSIARTAVAPMMSPIASKLVSFVPGIGPIASTAMDASRGLLSSALRSRGAAPRQATPGIPMGPATPFEPITPPGATSRRAGRLIIPAMFEG